MIDSGNMPNAEVVKPNRKGVNKPTELALRPLTEHEKELVEKNVRLAYHVIRGFRHKVAKTDHLQLEDAAIDGLIYAAKKFVPGTIGRRSGKVCDSFTTYAVCVIRSKVCTYLKHKYAKESSKTYSLIEDDTVSPVNLVDEYIEDQENLAWRERIWKLLDILPERDRELVITRFGLRDGCPKKYTEIEFLKLDGDPSSRGFAHFVVKRAIQWMQREARSKKLKYAG